MSDQPKSTGVRRREFLKILGATGAATATLGCGTGEVERLIPYLVHPDQTVPGVSSYYATTCRECSSACGVIAEVRDGRAIKLEGNPDHPLNRGALCARGQAALQGLYNPDRFRGPMVRQGGRLAPTSWDQAMQLLSQRLGEARAGGRAGNALFLNRHESGSFAAFLDSWLSAMGMPAALSIDALAQSAVMDANRQSYGVGWPSLDFGAARLIVSFGADFLDDWGATIPQQLDFADARAKLASAPRLVYVGPRRSLTGLNADEWVACRPGAELAIARAMQGGGGAGAALDQAAQQSGVPVAQLRRLAAEIATSKPSLILAGSRAASATELALTINSLNQSLGNVGVTVKPASPISAFDGTTSPAELFAAVERMRSGQVPIAFVRGVNPAFTIPRAMDFAAAFAKVPFKVAFSSYPDETCELCDLVLPDHHALESWGDATPVPGTIGLQQPTMEPVFNTRQTADVLLAAARTSGVAIGTSSTTSWRDLFISRIPGGAAALTAALPRGILRGSSPGAPARRSTVASKAPAAGSSPSPVETAPSDFHLVVYPSSVLGDGSGANKPWLQELPDPVTKIAWQTWVEIHPLTAARLGIEAGDLVRVSGPSGKAVEVPAYLYLGIRQDTVAMAFGRGHSAYGRYAKDVGVNPLDLLVGNTEARSGGAAGGGGGFSWTQATVTLAKSGGYMHLATTEGSARQHGRGIGRALTVVAGGGLQEASRGTGEHGEEIAPAGEKGAQTARPGQPSAEQAGGESMPGDASHDFLPGLRSPLAADAQGDVASGIERKEGGMYSSQHWSGMAKRRWAMTIDLARCTGCSACVTACYAENNIPTTGAPYQSTAGLSRSATPGHTGLPGSNIVRGREMAWIRLERYFEGGEDGSSDFDTRFVPMLCQHCGNAPCEPVCPVYATYHSPDGLNVQVYNRCVGTRYCSNNCPYKVRYFNWFGYGEPHRAQYAWPEPLHWQLNPDVTVRGKGVMEKCTFCVQRIREAEHRAKAEGRALMPDEFTVACAQACPSRAITFGDAADAGWTVAQLAQDARAYHVFEELNTYTAVVYLKKVNHPAPPSAAAGA